MKALKECATCEEEKPISEFASWKIRRATSDRIYVSIHCKICYNNRRRENRIKRAERMFHK